jgi:hypothetical protein
MRALIATVPTRWGTQVRQIDSLLKNEDALKCYADSPEASDTVKPILRDSSFWERLRALKSLLHPFHEEQRMSESNHNYLNKVAPRWIKLDSHLQELRAPGRHVFWRDIESYLSRGRSGWTERMTKQLLPIHFVAYILTPETRDTWSTLWHVSQNQVTEYILDYGGEKVLAQFFDYVFQQEDFHTSKRCWTIKSPELFWRVQVRLILIV